MSGYKKIIKIMDRNEEKCKIQNEMIKKSSSA